MMKQLLFFVSLFLFSQSCQQVSPKREILDTVIKTKVLRVATTGDYPPFTSLNESGTYEGMDIALAHELAATLGAKVQFVPTTWGGLLADLKQGKYDIAMGGISKKLSRQQVGLFSKGYQLGGKTPISRCEDADMYTLLEKIDQPGIRVIVNPGGTNESFVRKHIKKAELILHPDNTTIFQQLIEKKADVMITDAAEVAYQSQLHVSLCPTMPGQLFDTFEKGYLMPRDVIWKEYVDAWIEEMLLENKIEQVFANYLE